MPFFASPNCFEEITSLTTLNHFDNVLASWPFKIRTFLDPGWFREQEARYLYKKKRGMKGQEAPEQLGEQLLWVEKQKNGTEVSSRPSQAPFNGLITHCLGN